MGRGVSRVALIDSGVEFSLSTGGERVVDGCLFCVKETKAGDLAGHGTACAGIILAKSLAVQVHSVRIFDETLSCESFLLIDAIQWCIDNKMTV